MAKLILSLDGVVIKEVQLTKDKTTLGRRPYNDVVIDNLAVSGEHAVLQMVGSDVYIEDLNSTNGTYINGKAVKKQQLRGDDIIEVGKYKVRFQLEQYAEHDKTMILKPGELPPMPPRPAPAPAPVSAGPASVKVLNGAAAGREVALTKVVTTVGKPGVQVASITKRPSGYVLTHIEGTQRPAINGLTLTVDAVPLKSGDVIDIAGTQMQFLQTGA